MNENGARLAAANDLTSERDASRVLQKSVRRTLDNMAATVSFWVAIALPALYLPLLFHGVTDTDEFAAFVFLFGLHVVALIGGRSYGGAADRGSEK